TAEAPLRQRIHAASDRRAALVVELQRAVGRVIGMPPSELPSPKRPLTELGLDSMMAVELRNQLARALATDLPATLLLDRPPIDALADHLLATLFEDEPSAPRPVIAPITDARAPIAIVGMACRFPGARDLDAYWALLRDGVDAIGHVPRDRWDNDALYDPN